MNKIALPIMALSSILSLMGCSTSPTGANKDVQPDKVLSRIDDMSSRPEWLKESEPFTIKEGLVTSLGSTTIRGDEKVEAAYRIAENNAKAAIASTIESKLEFVFQNAEEGTGFDSNQARFIGAEASNLTTNSIRKGKIYWEKVATTTDSGERVTRIKVFTTVTMPESDFKTAIFNAVRKREGKGGLSAEFSKKVDQHWDQFVNAK